MKKFSFIFISILLSVRLFSVDLIGNFNLNSYGHYYPYFQNGSIHVNFDFEVVDGPINTPFKIGFYLSSDLIITTSDFKFHEFTINSCNNGNASFPDEFGTAAPYKIEQLLNISGIPKNQVVFLGVILDYTNVIVEVNDSNNFGPVNMPPFQITGNVGIELMLNSKKISIFPNPILDQALIDFQGESNTDISLKVLDITGKIVNYNSKISFPYFWSRSNLHNGVYIFIFEQKDVAILRKKVILN